MKYNLISKLFCWIFTPLFIFNPVIYYGQSDINNHKKYWYYKSRLNNDFVKVGTGAGESMPFNYRGFWANDFNDNVARLQIGDGTSTLGYYIALLATEYYLLKQNNQNTDKVKHELFCALNAINRLDAKAEDLNLQVQSFPLNGFFIRDDVPSTLLVNNYEHFNYFDNGGNINENSNSRGFASKFNAGAKATFSSWITAVEENNEGLFYESQDQAYNLLFGLAFVNKFVPDTETDGSNIFGYGSNETYLTKEARNIAGRIIDHIRDSKHIMSGASCAGGVTTGWKIYNPTTCNPVSTGADAQTFAYPLAELECLIKNGMSSNSGNSFAIGTIPHLCQGNSYHNNWSNSLGYTTWNAIASSGLPNIDNRVFVENLSAACNCVYGTVADKFIQETITYLKEVPLLGWLGVIIGWVWQIVSAIVTTFVPGAILNTTSTAINLNAYPVATGPSNLGPLDHGPLARKVLHGGVYTHNPDYTVEYLLNVAPCDDIYYFPGGNYGHWEWSSSDRLDHPERMGGDNDFRGEYNGIDYMLYHNLWYIYQKQEGYNQNIVDLSDIYIENTSGFGCFDVNAYETIRTYNTNIGCSAPTYWRAGKTIYFGAGSTITSNKNLHAYIQKFDCATENGVYRMANTDTSGSSDNMAIDSYAKGVKYHTVNYGSETQTEYAVLNKSNDEQNLITELPVDEDPVVKIMKAVYPEYSKELFVKPTITVDKVKVYFTLDEKEEAFIRVIDLNGKIIITQNNIKASDSGLDLDFTNFAVGTYFLKFITTKGTNKTQKIIKQ